jgi:hypothetical protein
MQNEAEILFVVFSRVVLFKTNTFLCSFNLLAPEFYI